MNKKYWTISRDNTTFYVSVDARSNWDTEGTLQRVLTIDPKKDLQRELERLFTKGMGFEITVEPPTGGRRMDSFSVPARK